MMSDSLSPRRLTCFNMRFKLPAITLACALGLGACSSVSNLFSESDEQNQALSKLQMQAQQRLLSGKTSRPSLSSLNLVPEGRDFENAGTSEQDGLIQSTAKDIPRLSLLEKRNEYEALLPLIQDENQRRQVAFRLADIKMLLAEGALETGELPALAQSDEPNKNQASGGFFTEAIDSYIQVLNTHQIVLPTAGEVLSDEQQILNRKQMDAMYQLTRALDLAGEKERSVEYAKQFLQTFPSGAFSTSEQHVELYFRIGEYYFNRQGYAQAAEYYSQVLDSKSQVQLQNTADFYGISAYMLGWSEFKQDKYDAALNAFDLMLLHTLGNAPKLSFLSLDTIDELSKGELRLVSDSIRVMALTFSYQGSTDAIDAFYQNRDNPNYRHLVVEELAQQYLDEDRFSDSADALLGFASRYPLHPRAVEFYVRHIDAFILGEFPDRVLLAKQDFVQTYALGNGVVSRLDSPVAQAALPYLRDYLKELAQTEHSIAQRIDTILLARQQAQNKQDGALDGSSTEQSFSSQFAAANTNNTGLANADNNAFSSASELDLQSLRLEAYTQAIAYYANFIETFSGNAEPELVAEVAERRYYLGEAYLALNQYENAINAFETYAYRDSANPLAADAAYAAILAHAELAKESEQVPDQAISAQVQTLPGALNNNANISVPLRAQQFSQQRFVSSFESDRRAPSVALNLMQSVFNQSNYIEAQRWATWLLEQSPLLHSMVPERQRSANLVMAHSEFALERYGSAEGYYRKLLANPSQAPAQMSPEQLTDQNALRDRLAASLYKQAENELMQVSLAPENLSQFANVYELNLSEREQTQIRRALERWQTLISDTPNASFRVAAQYDSATYFALLKEWPRAISIWLDFAKRFPEHPLTQNIDDQLLFAYQQDQDWLAAANILRSQWQTVNQMAEQSPQAIDDARLALYQAASYYQRAEQRDLALDTFRTYAHAYPQPMDMANEARFTMSEFYLESGEDSKRRFWLNKLVQAQNQLSTQSPDAAGTERSRYLAAMASMVFATDADNAFSAIKLTLPLNQSLAKKQTALTQAIQAYDQVMSFAVAEFSTQANYHLANLYLQLANDLMDSSRPADLSALESSQYELLLEEQAYPFEETAIDLHQNNAARAGNGLYDDYVKQSFTQLSKLLPARFNKQELSTEVFADDF